MQECTVAQENTDELIENAISQTHTKPQDVNPLTQPYTLELLEETLHQILLMEQIGPNP